MESTPISSLKNTVVRNVAKAFTLIEMMVVLAIIAIVLVVILTSQSTFNRTLVVKDTAYTVEYSLRQAQSYGISNNKFGFATNTAYGIDFNSVTPNKYIFYADTANSTPVPPWCPQGTAGQPDAKNGDCRYNITTNDTIIKTTAFTGGFSVAKFCAKTTAGTTYCSDIGQISRLDIIFSRPSPQAVMTATLPTGFAISNQVACSLIYVQAPGTTASTTIRVTQFGEISLNQPCP